MSSDKFYQIILPLKDKLFRLALSVVRNQQEAEDIIQDVLLKLWARRDEWDEIENLEAYCFRSTKNLALDRLEWTGYKHTDFLSPADENTFIDGKETPYMQIVHQEQLTLIYECMERLSNKQKLVFQLREIEGMSYKEIAEIADISEELVKVSLFRARKKIRELLSNIE